ncbi:GAF domain-containing protein [Embleya sp. NBC_00896]|uniref:GAF domain-containing protein n=1 Tax=Embleya sp. NBC_00896 TaxID=2975961 RepID=UPI002F914F3A|nr:GAF domain-containing protein [Embleya sp. NBC_00896]
MSESAPAQQPPDALARAIRRLELQYEAASRIGASLDATRTAQDVADLLVPEVGDFAFVSLAEAVLTGDEPPRGGIRARQPIQRAAATRSAGPWPARMIMPGSPVPPLPDTPEVRAVLGGGPVLVLDSAQIQAALRDPDLTRLLVPPGVLSVIAAPLYARGALLGSVVVWRTASWPGGAPFDGEDVRLLQEIASRASLGVDNARRYTRERRTAVALQQSLLPREHTETAAAETAGAYLPSGGDAGVGGDWFDVRDRATPGRPSGDADARLQPQRALSGTDAGSVGRAQHGLLRS